MYYFKILFLPFKMNVLANSLSLSLTHAHTDTDLIVLYKTKKFLFLKMQIEFTDVFNKSLNQ